MHKLLILALCAFVSGCAFNPQKANVVPTVAVMASNEGKGVSVAVRVVDERPSKSLGRRGTAYGAAAEITSVQEISFIVQREIGDALKKKGYSVVDYGDTLNPRLSVEVRLLQYSTSQGFWTGGVQIQSALKANATNGLRTYEKMYRSEKEERVMVVPTAETNERWINDALSDVLNQLLNDSSLFSVLQNGG
jgi:uncharacterized lipoprotein YajG